MLGKKLVRSLSHMRRYKRRSKKKLIALVAAPVVGAFVLPSSAAFAYPQPTNEPSPGGRVACPPIWQDRPDGAGGTKLGGTVYYVMPDSSNINDGVWYSQYPWDNDPATRKAVVQSSAETWKYDGQNLRDNPLRFVLLPRGSTIVPDVILGLADYFSNGGPQGATFCFQGRPSEIYLDKTEVRNAPGNSNATSIVSSLASHEMGHLLGLNHEGIHDTLSSAYYPTMSTCGKTDFGTTITWMDPDNYWARNKRILDDDLNDLAYQRAKAEGHVHTPLHYNAGFEHGFAAWKYTGGQTQFAVQYAPSGGTGGSFEGDHYLKWTPTDTSQGLAVPKLNVWAVEGPAGGQVSYRKHNAADPTPSLRVHGYYQAYNYGSPSVCPTDYIPVNGVQKNINAPGSPGPAISLFASDTDLQFVGNGWNEIHWSSFVNGGDGYFMNMRVDSLTTVPVDLDNTGVFAVSQCG